MTAQECSQLLLSKNNILIITHTNVRNQIVHVHVLPLERGRRALQRPAPCRETGESFQKPRSHDEVYAAR